jgi:hypothetical protein
MLREKNECIATKAFAALILDYEFPANEEWNIPAYVSCRILIEDLYKTTIHAETREKAIEIFKSGEWRNIA